MDAHMARQPIFDRDRMVFGYELLFRDGIQACFPQVDGSVATSSVLAQSFMSLDLDKMFQKKKLFINFPEYLLLNRTPLLFPADRLIVEILESITITDEMIVALEELALQGYVLALDDFVYDTGYDRLLPFVKIIKIDIRVVPFQEVTDLKNKVASYPICFLAEKVETIDEFHRSIDVGFDYFQGYFFCKPETIKSRNVSAFRLPLIQLMTEIAREEVQLDRVENIISHDVAISYKLLRYINSAFFFRGREISSIRQALLRLGDAGIRRFIPIIALSHMAAGKPNELLRTGVIRAKFSEILARVLAVEDAALKQEIPEWFLMGLFSVIDGIMDEPMKQVLARIDLSCRVKDALLQKKGHMANGLLLVRAYEAGSWKELFDLAELLGIHTDAIPRMYWEAVSWADELTADL